MRVFNAARFYGRTAVLVVVMTGALGGTASAAVRQLTLDPSAQLSPGRLHAYLTGTITCDPGDSLSLSGQVVQLKGGSGFGSTTFVCDGTPQTYTIDVGGSSGFPFPFPGMSGIFKPGKASAQVTASVCEFQLPFPGNCTTTFTDAIIRLKK